jgi:palmitoyl transferase
MKISVLVLSLLVSFSSFAEEANFAKRWWESSKATFKDIKNEGQNDLYVMGYAYHDRSTYTPEKLKDLNEGAYGIGFGRSKVNEKGNTEMLYAMAHLDSHSDVQVNAGYAWVKKFSFVGSFKVGIGYTAFLVSRSDFAGRIPLPFALPMATIDVGNISVNAILIPKLNDGINNGNVLFIFAKFAWDQKK